MTMLKLNNSSKTAEVDQDDFSRASTISWWLLSSGYVQGYIPKPIGKSVYLHQFIMNAENGQEFDHRNTNKLDCRKENLRPCTRSQNQANRGVPKNNTSGFKGVFLHKPTGRFQARLARQSLGYFDEAIDAAKAYNEAAKDIFGSFANLNKLHQR